MLLSQRFAFGSRLTLWFYRGAFPRRVSGDKLLSRRFAFGSRLSFFLCQEKRDGLRYLAFLFRRVEIAFVRSRGVGAVICLGKFTSALAVFLWRSRRVTGGRGERRTGLAAQPLCVFAQAHWLSNAFRGENAGAARPRLRQRVFDSLDSLHAAAGLRWCNTHPCKKRQRPNQRTHACKTRVHGKTRPALIYGRAGRAVYRCYQHAQSSRLEPPPSGAESG